MKKSIFTALVLVLALHTTVTAQTTPNNMVLIKGGTFTMGSSANDPRRESEEIQHQVTVNSFYMGKYEVTQKEYEEIMEENPSYFIGDNLPVESVTWYHAIIYCILRSQNEGLTPAYTIDKKIDPNNKNDKDTIKYTVTWNKNANGYRLPTEAEWEYACRAGTTTPFNTGNNITIAQANYNGSDSFIKNANGDAREKTTPVGIFAPNPWGLYDVHGNVYEWCWDWYGDYSSGSQTAPVGAVSGTDRVIRGGCWAGPRGDLRSSSRFYSPPDSESRIIGFRLVRQ